MNLERWKKIGTTQLYQLSLGVMVFFYGLRQIHVFSDNQFIKYCNMVVQLIACFFLIYIILKWSCTLNVKWIKYILIVIGIILIGLAHSHSIGWLRYFLLILAARNIRYKEILKTLASVFLFVFLFSSILYFLGVSDAGIARKNAVGIGFIHPNIAALLVTTLLFLWIGLKNKINNKIFLAIGAVALLIGMVLKTQVAIICLILFPVIYFIIKNGCAKEVKIIKFLVQSAQLIVFSITLLLVKIYPLNIYNSFRNRIDQLFSYRIYMNYNNVMKFGISMWGQDVQIYNVNEYAYNYFGGFLSNQKYNTVDNSYIIGLITIGIVPMLLMFICYIAVIRKAWNHKNYFIMTVLVLFSAYAFIENGCNEAFYVFPYFYLLASDDMKI